MKIANRARELFQNIGPTVMRFPLAFLYFIAGTGLNAIAIGESFRDADIGRFITTCYVGALAAVVAQIIYERFYSAAQKRWLLYGGAVLFSILYYFLVAAGGLEELPDIIRTSLIFFALWITFVWVPSIRSRTGFHHSLLAALRAGFLAFLFTLVLLIGVSLLLGAVDTLLFELPLNTYLHFQNPIYSFIGPLLFLIWTPVYPGKWLESRPREEQETEYAEMEKAITPPRSLEWLISYIVIPLIAVFTVILIAYLLLNISGDFWTDNLLEPMLVAYTTIGILVYLLASTLDNAFANMFIRWYPKVLVPLVFFQTIASFLRMREIGLTHGRYFVLMTGIFTIISGIIFIRFFSKRNTWIGGLLLVFLLVSITPPVDAFTVSRSYYVRQLENALERNNMLQNGQITAADEAVVSDEDKETITRSYQYLNRMNELDRVEGIEASSGSNFDFVNLFGFEPVSQAADDVDDIPDYRRASVFGVTDQMFFNVEEFDQVMRYYFNDEPRNVLTPPSEFAKDGERYTLSTEERDGRGVLLVRNNDTDVLVELDLQQAFEEVLAGASINNDITMEEATFREETEEAVLEIHLLQLNHYSDTPEEYDGEIVIKVGIK